VARPASPATTGDAPAFRYLDAAEATEAFVDGIAGTRDLALDTEAASFHRFTDRVYLLQLTARVPDTGAAGATSAREVSAVVDPLSAGPLAALGRLVEDPAVEVVFHDADYDLRLLRQDYGWQVRGLFDTRVAAQLLGERAFGLAALLEKEFGVKLDKRHQRADWSMRPLTADMLDYAAQDTIWLLQLRDRFRERLAGSAGWRGPRRSSSGSKGCSGTATAPTDAYLRIKGARDLTRRELALLRELVAWRDGLARELDRATFRVAANDVLLEVARVAPRTREALARSAACRAARSRARRRHAGAVERGLAVPDGALPRFPRAPRWDRDPDFDDRVNRLRTVRDRVAGDLDLDPGVLCARDRLEAVARRNPRSREELDAVGELRRWQAEVLGDAMLQALRSAPAGPTVGEPAATPPASPAAARRAERSPYRDA
jgi:ribonuclease D